VLVSLQKLRRRTGNQGPTHQSVSVGCACAYQAVGCGSTEIPKMVLIGADNGLMPFLYCML
jgi:hypothetical protein